MEMFRQLRAFKQANSRANSLIFIASWITTSTVARIWRWKLTYLWIALIALTYWIVGTTGNVLALLAFTVAFVGVHAGGYFYAPLWRAAMFHSEVQKRTAMVQQRTTVNKAFKFLVEDAGVLPKDTTHISSWMDEDEDKIVLHWRDTITGQTDDQIAQRLMSHKRELKTRRAEVREDDDMFLDIVFFKKDPLDEGHAIHAPQKVNLQNMSVPVGVDSAGKIVEIEYAGKAISLIGGQTGSGKTIAVSSVLTAFVAETKAVELHIIDNKGGADWNAFEPVSKTYMTVDGIDKTLQDVADFAEEIYAEMKRRVRTNLETLGESNFWEATPAQREAAGLKFLLCVIDECQEVFDKTGRTSAEMQLIGRITRLFTAIAKMGRSAGIHLMFVTQKPTSDSLPSSISGQAGIRIALSVDTVAAEESILGPTNAEDLNQPRAISIPKKRKGGAVFANDEGGRTMGRFYYFAEKEQRPYLTEIAETRVDCVMN